MCPLVAPPETSPAIEITHGALAVLHVNRNTPPALSPKPTVLPSIVL
jgi:hypothetical protein